VGAIGNQFMFFDVLAKQAIEEVAPGGGNWQSIHEFGHRGVVVGSGDST
jgi:hypothetical protein